MNVEYLEKTKETLKNETDENKRVETLRSLLGMDPNRDLIKETGIGKVLATIAAKGTSENEKSVAQQIIEKWKQGLKNTPARASSPKDDIPKGASSPKSEPGALGSSASSSSSSNGESDKKNNGNGESASSNGNASLTEILAAASKNQEPVVISLPDYAPSDEKRKKTINILLAVFASKLETSFATDSTIQKVCVEIEQEIYKINGSASSESYKEKFRTLKYHINDNDDLRNKILNSEVSAQELCKMSSAELANEKKKRDREKMLQEESEAKQSNWHDKNIDKLNQAAGISSAEGMFKCGRCKSSKTSHYMKQTRSADEPMTVFVNCRDCGNRWKFC